MEIVRKWDSEDERNKLKRKQLSLNDHPMLVDYGYIQTIELGGEYLHLRSECEY